uniref:Smr domain-containing protein n=1 Tax=Musca domestica TaxID=7370 RepID=T1P902_MUSDO
MTSNEGNPPTTSDDAKTDSAFNPDDIAPKPPRTETEPLSAQAQKVGNLIKQGYRVMVLMRGLPGVGKTYSARSIVKNYVDLQPPFCSVGDFIFSTDDYFYNAKGVYKYNVNLLNEAHEFNQYRVREKAMSGFSPIFVDNTNMKAWEMLPYVKCAIENGYLIEIIEPKPSWRKSPNVLARRNLHGVPADKIRHMIDKYEKTSVPELLKMFKTTKYTVSLPQFRSIPPIANVVSPNADEKDKTVVGQESQTMELPHSKDTDTSNWTPYDTNAPKDQRKKFKSSASPPKQKQKLDEELKPNSQQTSSQIPIKSASERDVYSLLEQKLSNAWKPYEAESIDFWGPDLQSVQVTPSFDKNKINVSADRGKSLIDLLRDHDTDKDTMALNIKNNEEITSSSSFTRHSIDCPNENASFITLRQIYPNKEIGGLWDLFVKCNGDIDWAVDILLKEDELSKLRGDTELQDNDNDFDEFVCSCKLTPNEPQVRAELEYPVSHNELHVGANETNVDSKETKPSQRPQRQRFARPRLAYDRNLLEVKENIENCFVLGDSHYSKHVLKIRNSRNGLTSGDGTSIATTQECEDKGENIDESSNKENDDDVDEDIGNESNENEAMLEMSLGEHLVQQLLDNFRNESSFEEQVPSTLPLNLKVFMPRSLAKQLYMLWIESAYNHLEEERQQMMREDEDFARLLKHPKYSEYKQSPSNLREMLDIEYAWNLYKRDKEGIDMQRSEMEKLSQPTDLAAHLTQMKLCETFPDIPRETLLDILSSTDNNYKETVSILQSTMHDAETMDTHLEDVQNSNEYQKQSRTSNVNVWDDENNTRDPSFSPEAAKRLALKEFEEARNLAAHHCQLRAECYQKAKEAIQAGNGGAGLYYSQIANLHKQKIDMYNHRAANCIMNVHKYTQNNPDHLDLHYFHLLEAMACLDLFLDRHITSLRLASRNYKFVFIITGRGKHSAGGVSVIKSKVKARLEERCLKWSEVNPGLLKVKVFSGSRHSQNF